MQGSKKQHSKGEKSIDSDVMKTTEGDLEHDNSFTFDEVTGCRLN